MIAWASSCRFPRTPLLWASSSECSDITAGIPGRIQKKLDVPAHFQRPSCFVVMQLPASPAKRTRVNESGLELKTSVPLLCSLSPLPTWDWVESVCLLCDCVLAPLLPLLYTWRLLSAAISFTLWILSSCRSTVLGPRSADRAICG